VGRMGPNKWRRTGTL